MKEILKLGGVLFTICLIAALALGFTNEITAPTIEKQRALKNEMARKEVLPNAEKFECIEQSYQGLIKLDTGIDVPIAEVYKGIADGQTVGYVVKSLPGGFGGEIEVVTGLTTEGIVTGVRIGKHQETPGLGTEAKKPEFYLQYNQKKAKTISVNKERTSDTEIQAISGATITSKSVTSGVNAAGITVKSLAN